MFVKSFECPSCGGSIKRENPASRSITCPYCGQTSHINADTLEAAGSQHLLIDYGSMLSIGAKVTHDNTSFFIQGRVRYTYGDGFWDEWYAVSHHNEEGWIQEDDGAFIWFSQVKETTSIKYDNIPVGVSVDISPNYHNVFITSKGVATTTGGEGEFPFQINPQEKIHFIEGIYKGKILTVELHSDENIIYIGEPFEIG